MVVTDLLPRHGAATSAPPCRARLVGALQEAQPHDMLGRMLAAALALH